MATKSAGKHIANWLRPVLAVVVTAAIFYYMLRPIRAHWADVRDQVQLIQLDRFALAVGMFILFLFYRAICWRRILIGLGHRLPIPAAVRIWTSSELARYLPGAVSQVIGRAYLVRPYGVSAAVSSTSQLLELAAFLLANFVLAMGCLLWFGVKQADADARPWLIAALVLTPALALLLHPRVFYSLVNRLLVRFGKPALSQRLSGWALLRLLGRLLLALLWQSAAVFILVQPVLHLKYAWWWTIAGAYCLAWCAGFLAFWAPGGIGVREVVFVAVLSSYLSSKTEGAVRLPQSHAELFFLAILLRLWTIASELLLAGGALLVDARRRHASAPSEGSAAVTSVN